MTELSGVVQSFYDNWGAGRVSESRALFTDDAVIVSPKALRQRSAGVFGNPSIRTLPVNATWRWRRSRAAPRSGSSSREDRFDVGELALQRLVLGVE
jgi:hypothetical protein